MKARVLTALVAIPIVLGAVLIPHPIPFVLLAAIAFGLGIWEYGKLVGELPLHIVVASTLFFCGVTSVWCLYRRGPSDFAPLAIAFAAGVVGMTVRLKRTAHARVSPFVLVGEAFGWIGAPLIALVFLHGLTPAGVWWKVSLLMVFLPLWAGDTAGIFVGMTLGRHKLAPAISPKKTVEGAVGNLLAAVMVSLLLASPLHIPFLTAGLVGAVIGLLGQAGDLFESWVKRTVGQKDSGTILPGHGGILDRIDSALFIAIPAAILLTTIT